MESEEFLCSICGDRHVWPGCKPKLRDVHVWLKPDQFAIVSQAAEAAGLGVTAYVRSAAVIAAYRSRGAHGN